MSTNIGRLLSDKRIQLGLTQRQIALLTGTTEATVSRWESGKIGNMRRDKIAKLAAALNISPLSIMGIPETSGTENTMEDMSKSYYHDEETARLAQEAHDRPELRLLFDASRKLSPKDLKTVTALVKSLAGDSDE